MSTPVYTRNGDITPLLKIRDTAKFSVDDCTSYEWTYGDTLDNLAYKMYGDSSLRWVILDANPMYRTEFHIEVGDIINVPDYEQVVELVNGD